MPLDSINSNYWTAVAAWLVVLFAFLAVAWTSRASTGLTLCYFINLAQIHLISGIIQSFPWHETPFRAETVQGFMESTYGLVAFAVGNILGLLILPVRDSGQRPSFSYPAEKRRLFLLFSIGLGVLLGNTVLARLVPSISSVLSAGLWLASGSVAIGWCYAYWHKDQGGQIAFAALPMVFPFWTVVFQGFLLMGASAIVPFFTLMLVVLRPRWLAMMIFVLVTAVGFSIFITYMASRREIRQAVWGGQSLENRLSVTSTALYDRWRWFDYKNKDDLNIVEGRLNQNYLIGVAMNRLDSGANTYAGGETFYNALLALIPRVIWPNKPNFAGSYGLVSMYTGIYFPGGTSVGIGHIMELYVNGGLLTVILGMGFLGLTIRLLETSAGNCLHGRDTLRFLKFFMVGMLLTDVGGNFANLLPALIGAIVLATFVESYFKLAPPRAAL